MGAFSAIRGRVAEDLSMDRGAGAGGKGYGHELIITGTGRNHGAIRKVEVPED